MKDSTHAGMQITGMPLRRDEKFYKVGMTILVFCFFFKFKIIFRTNLIFQTKYLVGVMEKLYEKICVNIHKKTCDIEEKKERKVGEDFYDCYFYNEITRNLEKWHL